MANQKAPFAAATNWYINFYEEDKIVSIMTQAGAAFRTDIMLKLLKKTTELAKTQQSPPSSLCPGIYVASDDPPAFNPNIYENNLYVAGGDGTVAARAAALTCGFTMGCYTVQPEPATKDKAMAFRGAMFLELDVGSDDIKTNVCIKVKGEVVYENSNIPLDEFAAYVDSVSFLESVGE